MSSSSDFFPLKYSLNHHIQSEIKIQMHKQKMKNRILIKFGDITKLLYMRDVCMTVHMNET